jgi:hypothetical protein
LTTVPERPPGDLFDTDPALDHHPPMDLRPFAFTSIAMVLSCAAAPPDDSTEAAPGEADVQDPAAASARREVRVPYLGGAFVTYSGDMPVDVHQAIAGQRTDHTVIVWAGE